MLRDRNRYRLRLATQCEYATVIVPWRSAHHREMAKRNGLRTRPGVSYRDAVWLACTSLEDEVLAAIAYFDVGHVRTVYDFYWQHGRSRAAVHLVATVLLFADQRGLSVTGNTNCVNREYRRLLTRFGFRETHVDLANDVVYFARARTVRGDHVRQLGQLVANQRESGHDRRAAAADPNAAYQRGDG